MKKLILGLALATTGIAGVAIAQAPAPMAGPMGDKTVTRAEAQTKAADMFARMDTNKDGKLDDADRAAHRTQMFDRMDANKDGSVSRNEFAAAHQRKAGDGQPREGRMGKHGGHHMGGGKMMTRMADANKDGVVSKDEFLAAHAKMFDHADANKDGKVTPEERKAHHAQMRQSMGAKRAPAGHGDHAGHAGHGPATKPAN